MVHKKALSAQIFLIAATLVIASSAIGVAADSELPWTTLTSFKDVRRMRIINDTLYALTSGGILAITTADEPGRPYLNTDGLGTVDVTDAMIDADGQTWVTGYGRLVKFHGFGSRQYLFFDSDAKPFRLLTMKDEGDYIWVGSELGLVLFSKTIDGGQIQDSYTMFGDLNPNPDVYDILLQGDTIWLATSSGLTVADKSNLALLKSPANWTTFSPSDYPELASDTVTRVVSFESDIYIGTSEGFYRLDRSVSDTTLTEIPVGEDTRITDLKMEHDTLFVYSGSGLRAVVDGALADVPIAGLPSAATTGVTLNGSRWVAVSPTGIYSPQGGTFREFPFTGATGNLVSGLAINERGILTAGLTLNLTDQYYEGVWIPRNFWVRDRSMDVISDSSGNAWVGTFGNGLWMLTDSSTVHFNQTNSSLRGNSDLNGESYVVIEGLAADSRYIYALAFRALNGYPVAIGDMDKLDGPDGWDSLGVSDGITDVFVNSLDKRGGFLAVGTQQRGVFYCYIGGDPFDKSDDYCVHYTKSNGYLISENIQAVRFDPNGDLWVGTNSGLSRYDPGVDFFVDVTIPAGFGPVISAIDFDGRGNAWVGSSNGLLFIDAATSETQHYTTLSSDLVDDDVRSITFDRFTGELYIGTASGISIRPSDYGPPAYTIDSVYAFPNPFVIRSDEDRLRFNYGRPGTVSIYSIAGELLKELPVSGAWDGRDEAGKRVASGVYLYVLTDEDGNVGRGKFLLVRKQ